LLDAARLPYDGTLGFRPAGNEVSMDLAKNLAQWRDLPPEQWMARANRVLPPLAALLIVILLALQAAGLTWRLLARPAEQDIVPATVVFNPDEDSQTTAGNINYDAIAGLFGEAPETGAEPLLAEEVLDAQETTLNLTLSGALQRQELPERGSKIMAEAGIAIIGSGRNAQKVYRTGDVIDGGNGAKLHSVFTDRVLLDRGGRLEKLSFPKPEDMPQTVARLNSNVRPTVRTLRTEPALSTAASVADAVGNAAAILGEHMQIAQHEENGEMIGYRLQPRQNSQVFAQLGLEPGDVLTEVNGIRLNDLRNTARVFQALSETPQASVTIRRNGVDQSMTIDIGQLQQLSDSLQ
jgi:general secretion pathway protein C